MYHVAVCEDEAAIREDISRRCSDILTGLDVPHDMRAFSAAEELERHNKDKVVAFQDRGRIVRLPAPDIRYLESFEHGVRVHTASETLYFFIPLSQAKDMLPPPECLPAATTALL